VSTRQKPKRRHAALLAFALILVISLVVVSCIVVGVLRFSNPAAPLAKKQTMRTQSFDGKLTLIEEHVRVNGVMVAQISVQNIRLFWYVTLQRSGKSASPARYMAYGISKKTRYMI